MSYYTLSKNVENGLGFSVRLECMFSVCSSVLLKNYGSCALFTGPTSTFFNKNNFKTGLMVLFTHLKIILLQCFQFSVFSNKRYPNRPLICFSYFLYFCYIRFWVLIEGNLHYFLQNHFQFYGCGRIANIDFNLLGDLRQNYWVKKKKKGEFFFFFFF